VLGFALVGTQHRTIAVFLAFAATAIVWTPMVPLTDAYALRGVVRHGFNYGPVRLWGSAAFVAGALACGLLIDVIAPVHLIWVIAGIGAMCAAASLALQPLDRPASAHGALGRGNTLLRDPGFLAIIVSAGLVQSSHAAYYTFSAITWQAHGLGGLTIAGLWALGVLAEIVIFALSPRFSVEPSTLVVIGAVAAVLRWSITAQEPPLALLALVQLGHGLTYGITQVGTMELLVRHVPVTVMARGQGYFSACSGLLTSSASILSGALYAAWGQHVYYAMALMAACGAILMWSARHRLAAHPHSVASGG
jgi:PPP family 3-phenylpropionic acid transporter